MTAEHAMLDGMGLAARQAASAVANVQLGGMLMLILQLVLQPVTASRVMLVGMEPPQAPHRNAAVPVHQGGTR